MSEVERQRQEKLRRLQANQALEAAAAAAAHLAESEGNAAVVNNDADDDVGLPPAPISNSIPRPRDSATEAQDAKRSHAQQTALVATAAPGQALKPQFECQNKAALEREYKAFVDQLKQKNPELAKHCRMETRDITYNGQPAQMLVLHFPNQDTANQFMSTMADKGIIRAIPNAVADGDREFEQEAFGAPVGSAAAPAVNADPDMESPQERQVASRFNPQLRPGGIALAQKEDEEENAQHTARVGSAAAGA